MYDIVSLILIYILLYDTGTNTWGLDPVGGTFFGSDNDKLGHNHHYWTGPGTSAFSPECRVTLETDTPDHVIKRCHCKYCRKRNYKPLCLHLECNNTAIDYKKKYCKEHYTN